MKHATEMIAALLMIVTWLAGIVLASGWLKLLAAVFPFYAWYLVVEKAMEAWL